MTDDKTVPDSYKLGKKCRPDDLDNAPPPIENDVTPNYPAGTDAKYPYNFENSTHKILVIYQDGHHPDDRWNLTDSQIGVGTAHEHDDWKRSPPTILDQNPERSQVGFYAKKRLPDSSDAYSVPGDQLPGSE